MFTTNACNVLLVRHGRVDMWDGGDDAPLDPDRLHELDDTAEEIREGLGSHIGRIVLLASPKLRTSHTAEYVGARLTEQGRVVEDVVMTPLLSIMGAARFQHGGPGLANFASLIDGLVAETGTDTAVIAASHDVTIMAIAAEAGLPRSDIHYGYGEVTVLK